MAKGGGGGGGNSKKAAGNAKKAENAAAKAAQAQAQVDAQEDAKWSKGAKSNKKADDAAAKKAEADRKKAERDALLAAEEADQPSKPKNNKGGAAKKGNAKPASRVLDLGQLDDDGGKKSDTSTAALNASGINNALDALSLTGAGSDGADKIEKHPERRFKAAYAAFEARRLPEIEAEHPGLRRNQRIDMARKEFEKHPDNPFNQARLAYNATRDDVADLKASERQKIEDRLAE